MGTDVYWARGMSAAGVLARQDDPDAFLWLNDDVVLARDALTALDACRKDKGSNAVVVGQLADAAGRGSYGGLRRVRGLTFEALGPRGTASRCDTMNGNVVLIPKVVAEIVGHVDPVFPHAMGDIDWGLRASEAGFVIWQAPGSCRLVRHKPARRHAWHESTGSIAARRLSETAAAPSLVDAVPAARRTPRPGLLQQALPGGDSRLTWRLRLEIVGRLGPGRQRQTDERHD